MAVSILALDLGDTTGWAKHTDSVPWSSGIFNLGIRLNEHPGARWRRARDTIRMGMRGHTWCAWELIVNSGGNFSKSTLFGLECQVVELCHELGVEPLTVAPGTLKKFATGYGNATKDELRIAGRSAWPGVTFATHDEIDARWILKWAVAEIHQRTAGRPMGCATKRKKPEGA